MQFPKTVTVTNQEVDLTNLTNAQKAFFFSVAKHIKEKYVESGQNRYVVSISGPSGSGKSVLSSIIEKLLEEENDFTCQLIELDAFHYSNSELLEKRLLDFKGRYDTYNTERLKQLLNLFKNNTTVTFPRYSRGDHESHVDGPVIAEKNVILLLPGLWFQYNDMLWSEIRKFIDYSITLEGSLEKFKQNTITRHIRGGRTLHDAAAFYIRSDLKNTDEIFQNSYPSNLSLPYYEDIQSEKDIKLS